MSESAPQRTTRRPIVRADGSFALDIVDDRRGCQLRSMFRRAMRLSWLRLLFSALVAYLLVAAGISFFFIGCGEGLQGLDPRNQLDLFFFSAQVLATGGVEGVVPVTTWTRGIHLAATLLGLFAFALFTGLCFAKFSLAGPRVRFTQRALRTTYDGKPALVLRVANEQDVALVDVAAKLVVILDAPTAEGVPMKRLFPLELTRDHAPLFVLSWTLVHMLDEESPLRAALDKAPAEQDFLIYASVGGLDRTTGQAAHAFQAYEPGDLLEGGQFADAVENLPDGTRRLRLDRLDEVVPGEMQDDPPDD